MAAIAWITVENALHAWLVAATGLAAGQVIWLDGGGPRPPKPYIAISPIVDIQQIGHDWRVVDAAPDPEDQAELRVRSRGHRTARVQLQCFAADPSPSNPTPGREAVQILTDAISGLPLHVYDLDLAGIGIADTTAVQLVQGRRGGILEPQATAAVNIHLASEVEARLPEVAHVQIRLTEESIGEVGEVWIPDPPPES